MKKETTLHIRAGYFPTQARLTGVVLFVLAFVAVPDYGWLSVPLVLAGAMLVFGYSGTGIDTIAKTIREYTSWLFFTTGETFPYNSVERIFINRAMDTQKMYTAHTLHSSTFRQVVYNAYLKLDNGKKVFLTSRKDKDQLFKLLQPLVEALETELVDTTN